MKHRKSSTIALMASKGIISDEDIYAELGEIVSHKKQGRVSDAEKIYFNSVGMSIEDISVATRIYTIAKENKLGIELELWRKPHWF